MDSVPSYRPASVPPPVIPPTPSHESSVFSGPLLIVLGFLFGAGGLYFLLNDGAFNFNIADTGTPPEEKLAAMEEADKRLAAEGRTVVPVADKLSYLNLIQEVNAARVEILEDTESEAIAVEPQGASLGYLSYLKTLRAEAEAEGVKASAGTE